MNVVLWVVTVIVALGFVATGLLKLLRSREDLAATGLGWVEDFSPTVVKLIGAAEVAGAIGLVLPALLDIAPILVPIAATGLVVVMIGAVATHVRRRELPLVAPAAALLVLSLFIAIFRFSPNGL